MTKTVRLLTLGIIFLTGMMPLVFADITINVMAVNGAPQRKETPVKFNLPGDLKADDILDTGGLQLEYNVNDSNYIVTGNVTLDPKESKTFRIKVKDVWQITPEQAEQIKAEVDKGFEQIGKLRVAAKGELLKQQLLSKLDFITQQYSTKADTIEKRMDAFRAYHKELKFIQDKALAVDYWRSEPGQDEDKIIRLKIEASNPQSNPSKTVKIKSYLPGEIKPEDVIEAEGFEVRFDAAKQQAFLFREEDIVPGQKKAYTIGIRDIWFVPQRDIDYLRKRADYAYDFLKNSKYDESSKFLYDHQGLLLKTIETAQTQPVTDIKDHISMFRVDHKLFEDARTDVENLEKLLSILREDLEKSKVNNVLQKMRSLKGVASVAKQMFDKKPTPSTAWTFIGWTVIFVAFLTLLNFMVWILRSKDKKSNAEHLPDADVKGKT
jgi:hypothetical protein